MNRVWKAVKEILILTILFVTIYFLYEFYQKNNYADFIRSEAKPYVSEFSRSKEEKYSDSRSYLIESDQYNDAMFYKNIGLKKNTAYKITCMVKTEDIETEESNSGIGAQISIEGTTERSVAISGTQDWQKIELIFNSKNRENANIGFRLGGYLGQAKGRAWFSDFTIEEGTVDNSNTWNFACFIFNMTDVVVDGKEVKLNMTQSDISDIKNTLNRFQSSCRELSEGKMTANCDIYNIDTPLNKLSYDSEYGYHVAPEDVEEQIKQTLSGKDYDHVFVIIR